MVFATSWTPSFMSWGSVGQATTQDSPEYQLQNAILQNNSNLIKNDYPLSKELINSPLPNGELPLSFAIRQQSREMVLLLFANSEIDLNQKDDQGLTALDHLFLMNNQEFKDVVLRFFCKKTVDDVKNNVPLSPEKIDDIKLNILTQNAFNLNPLHLAAQRGDLQQIQQIAVDLDKQTSTGQTALHYAILGKHKAVIDFLIRSGVNPNTADNLGYTPIHYAIVNEDFTTVRLLIEKGVDPLIGYRQIQPLSLMINIIQHRSHERDPLKLETLQTLMCACTIAAWIHSRYGDSTSLLATILEYASPCLVSLATFDQIAKIYNAPKNLYSFLIYPLSLVSPFFDKVMIVREASLVIKTYFAAVSLFQGVQAGWRNRNLDPSNALKKFLVHLVPSVNAGSSIRNIVYPPITTLQENIALQQEVKTHLGNNNCTAALKSASSISFPESRDDSLHSIVDQCIGDLKTVNQAASLMDNPDSGIEKIFKHQLSLGKCDYAEVTASKIRSDSNRDIALQNIVTNPRCLEEDLPSIQQAVMSMQPGSGRENAVNQVLDTLIDKKKLDEANDFLFQTKNHLSATASDNFSKKIMSARTKQNTETTSDPVGKGSIIKTIEKSAKK